MPASNPEPIGAVYKAVGRPYVQRFAYHYRRHAFEKLRQLDLPLAEFQQLLGDGGEVIYEAEIGLLTRKELILFLQWRSPLHVVILIDEACEEERLVTIYEPDPAEWTTNNRRRR